MVSTSLILMAGSGHETNPRVIMSQINLRVSEPHPVILPPYLSNIPFGIGAHSDEDFEEHRKEKYVKIGPPAS